MLPDPLAEDLEGELWVIGIGTHLGPAGDGIQAIRLGEVELASISRST